ncbi:hypothetical protein B0J14DRAFT_53758 [Halenospora varia]|nr:hypothetical protein B0J14DRAFT_53758 [Halenospora varia]
MKISQLSASVVAAILAIPSSLATPIAEIDAPMQFVNISSSFVNNAIPGNGKFQPRSGNHYAHFCDNYNCGDAYTYVDNFGCGGKCYNGFFAHSVALGQDGSGNPKPTGSMFSSSDCSGSYQSVGILSGQLTSCTTKSGSGGWQSAYLYFNC